LAPVAIWGVTKEALTGSRALADELKTGITMHIAETPFEAEHCKATFGSKELDLYDSLGFLGSDLLGVHCVYLDDHDLKLVKSRGVKISHNAISNMYLSSGVAPVPRMLEMGITVGLGTDGAASNNNQDMLQLLKVSALLPKVVHAGDPTIITAEKVLEMATIDGARAIGAENEIGSIEKGKKADITIVDLNGVFVAPAHDPVSALVYSATSENITDTIVDGKILMRDRKLTALDEGKAIRAANAASEDLLKEAGLSQLSCRLALKDSLGNKR
jgi:5-methylthioadenosine/S-adenosylhomocysteine deaminase